MTGPGWTTERDYRAGDRVLLHARCGPSGSRLVNGTTATVTRVDETGLTVRLDRSGQEAVLPASFVQGTRRDGSPNLSHAWARTVDGAQGGTWEACHLLGSSGPGRLPGLHRPVPLPPAHPHLEHQTSSSPSTTAGSWPTSATRPRWSPSAGPPARSHPGRPLRSLDPRPATARPDRRTRTGPRRPSG